MLNILDPLTLTKTLRDQIIISIVQMRKLRHQEAEKARQSSSYPLKPTVSLTLPSCATRVSQPLVASYMDRTATGPSV